MEEHITKTNEKLTVESLAVSHQVTWPAVTSGISMGTKLELNSLDPVEPVWTETANCVWEN